MFTALLFVAGLALLVVGGELLVRGASSLATAVGISPLVVGLTVVALGTSAPELAVSVRASLAGQGDLAVGNVVGSNIFNVLFILGLSALIRPLAVSSRLVRLDVPIMIASAGLMWWLCADGVVSRADGLVLLLGIVAYTAFLIVQGRRETRALRAEVEAEVLAKRVVDDAAVKIGASPEMVRRASVPLQLVLIAAGLVALVFGARFLVDAAVTVATALGVSELVIGLTIVAAGTSLPEVAASLIAAARGHRDIAIGNVVGSNVFNALCILGAAGVANPIPVPESALRFDLPVMLGASVACLPIFFRGRAIVRWEGLLFLGYYAAYTAYLILDAAKHAALPAYGTAMLLYVIPVTAVTLTVLVVQDWQARRAGRVVQSAA
jgi:cation:H+ antiporter